jgi:hypothetical protein
MKLVYGIGISLILVLGSNLAWSASADDVVRACKTAIAETENSDYNAASLMKIKPRRQSYETWFNVSDGDREFRTYCYIKRGELEQFVTMEGRWSNNPKRPELQEVASLN